MSSETNPIDTRPPNNPDLKAIEGGKTGTDDSMVGRTDGSTATSESEAKTKALNKRLDAIGWGLFLVMIGGLGLVPNDQVPSGAWLVGVAIIWFALNAIRYLNGVKMSNGTIILGILALVIGLGQMTGLSLQLLPILLILLGASLVIRHLYEDRVA